MLDRLPRRNFRKIVLAPQAGFLPGGRSRVRIFGVFYRRRLPHWDPGGKIIFITWRLHPSVPARTLRNPAIASIVGEAIEHGAVRLRRYQALAWTIMPEHVHLLLRPSTSLAAIMRSLKGWSACAANRRLGRTGKPFWQDESFDHWLRSDGEIRATARYILCNPVRRGLVSRPEQWPWSWTAPELARQLEREKESAI